MKKSNKKPFKDLWMLAEDIPDIDLFFAQIWLSAFVNNMEETVGRNYKKVLCVFKNIKLKFYYKQKDSERFSAHVFGLVNKNPSFGHKINKEIIYHTDKLVSFAEGVRKLNLKKLTNKELWKIWQLNDDIHTELYTWGWLPNVTDMFHANFTNYLHNYLKKIGVSEDKINEYLVILTNPTKSSIVNQEREEFFKLALVVSHTRNINKLLKFKPRQFIARLSFNNRELLRLHWEKWHHLAYNFIGPKVTSIEEYAYNLQELLLSGIKPHNLLNRENTKRSLEAKKQNKLLAKLKVDNKHRQLFKVWGDFMLTKFYRRNGQIRTVVIFRKVMQEIGNRLGLSLSQVRTMLNSEIKKSLLGGQVNKHELTRRVKLCVYYGEKSREVVYTGIKAKKLINSVPEAEITQVTELHGQCGCVGKAIGQVKLIFRPRDMIKMKQGDILVSIATDPDIVPAMQKAGAIVTEQGGVTSHAAIVSRELGIPCLIGTKIATKVFKDGDMVEVDAAKGIVRKII